MSVRLVVFDMAGTTIEDDNLVLDCFVAAARLAGIRVTADEINERMGLSKREVFADLARRQVGEGVAADALRDKGYDAFRAILEGVYAERGAKPIRGAETTFAWLRERGIKIALNTGFYRRVTDILVSKLGWEAQVDAVVCVDDVREGRPAPYMIQEAMQRCLVRSVREVVVVGDTPSDMNAGLHSGVRAVVGVTSGAHSAASLRRTRGIHILAGIWELPPFVSRLTRLS